MKDLKTFGINTGEGRYYEEIIYSLALIYNVVQVEIANFLKSYDLTPGKLNILLAIRHQAGKEGIKQVDISKHLIVTPSNMTKMIDKLEKEKFVTRSALKGDRRVNIVNITPRGEALLDQIWEDYNALLKSSMKDLNLEKQKMLSLLLMEWLDKLQ